MIDVSRMSCKFIYYFDTITEQLNSKTYALVTATCAFLQQFTQAEYIVLLRALIFKEQHSLQQAMFKRSFYPS